MTDRLTAAVRQQILNDFVEKHGKWDPQAFVDEVRQTSGQHPAWTWFTWDDADAAEQHRVWQARSFVRGLRVSHSIEVVERGKVVVREIEAPAVFSPLNTRQAGGGYVELDPEDPESMGMFCAEAATALQTWLHRYESAIAYAGNSPAKIKAMIAALDAKAPADQAA